jgi:glutamate/tyrosine decarboxylase-like PLP-dependent enzyme
VDVEMGMTMWDEVRHQIEALTADIRSMPVVEPAAPLQVRREIEAAFDLQNPVALEQLTRQVAVLLRRYTTHVTHPRYFGLFNPSVTVAGIVGDTLAALYNPQLATWQHAPAANELERMTLAHLARALGLDSERVFANFTSGGAEANMSAVLVALAHRFPQVAEHGVAAIDAPPVIYITSESHHSFVKIARMAGLGTRALAEIPLTSRYTLDARVLAERMRLDAHEGRTPFMIVGTVGTTGGGLVDPLDEIADVAADNNAWFHADAAWGGAAVLVPRLRPVVRGIERADSITWDAHKWLSAPMGAGMFFCRHPESVRRAFALSASYMPPSAGEDTVDPYATTTQWSRRAIGLKVFMTIAELGAAGMTEMLERQTDMGDRLRARLHAAGWTIANDTALPLVCFTHDDIVAGRTSTADILRHVYARGRVWISDVVLGGRARVLRACITSFRTCEEDVKCLVDEIELARAVTGRTN